MAKYLSYQALTLSGGEEMKKMVGVFVDLSNITHLLEKKTESTVLNTVRNQWLKVMIRL